MKHHPVDVWLVYGSFSYGFEGAVEAYARTSLHVSVRVAERTDLEQVVRFLQTVTADPRGLLRTEVRIFLPEDKPAPDGVHFPVCLFTDLAPTSVPGEHPLLRLLDLRGVTEADERAWERLLDGVTEPHGLR